MPLAKVVFWCLKSKDYKPREELSEESFAGSSTEPVWHQFGVHFSRTQPSVQLGGSKVLGAPWPWPAWVSSHVLVSSLRSCIESFRDQDGSHFKDHLFSNEIHLVAWVSHGFMLQKWGPAFRQGHLVLRLGSSLCLTCFVSRYRSGHLRFQRHSKWWWVTETAKRSKTWHLRGSSWDVQDVKKYYVFIAKAIWRLCSRFDIWCVKRTNMNSPSTQEMPWRIIQKMISIYEQCFSIWLLLGKVFGFNLILGLKFISLHYLGPVHGWNPTKGLRIEMAFNAT